MRIAFDGSSILWTALRAGKDREGLMVEFEGKRVLVNTAAHGYENVVNHIVCTLNVFGLAPKDAIFVWEGMSSKAPRLAIATTYKAKRGKKPYESYAEFSKAQDMIKDVFSKLGSLFVTQDEVEGDDILAYLAVNSEDDLVIDSYDNDLSVLNGTNKYGAKIVVNINGVAGENKYGDWPCRYITIYKAMVGDTSDSISGIKGFGEVAWKELVALAGVNGLQEMARMAELGSLDDLADEIDKNKLVRQIYEGRESFLTSWKLAKLYPEWVNTMRNPLVFTPSMVKGAVLDERLRHWASQTRLITANNWEKFKPWAKPLLLSSEYVGLDIETSTPDESDEWLQAQGKEDGAGVDVIGSELTGMSLTWGNNNQYTVYMSVDHADTDNIPSSELRDFIAELSGCTKIIHNTSFEGTVLYNAWGSDWPQNGFEGFLPNMIDTVFEASYVDENDKLGLKHLSKKWFNYDQVSYDSVTTIDDVRFKMNGLTGQHVKDYGCDDTIVCSSLHNFFKLFMELEHTYKVCRDVEDDAMYLHIQSFVHGVDFSVAKSKELERIDDETHRVASVTLESYLIEKGWEGSHPPVYDADITVAQIKEAFQIVRGEELDTRVRTLDKLCAAMRAQGEQLLPLYLEGSAFDELNKYVASKYTGKPTFNSGSPKQLQKLLYETMALPVRVFNKVTPIARAKGVKQGSPKTDSLAITYAERLDAGDREKEALTSLRLIKMVETRRGLYYSPYPNFVHWKTGKIHSSHRQCSTNTRRASSSAPNLQQVEKAAKVEGEHARFRETIMPHKRKAVVVSLDFAAQELRVIADYCKDVNMLACFVGDQLRDMHALTGLGIAQSKQPEYDWTYEKFMTVLHDKKHEHHPFIKECRTLGKKTNFTTEYGSMAPKLAQTLLVTETEAQAFIDAKEAAFPQASEWKQGVISQAKLDGYVRSKLGGVRHLRDAFNSTDRYEASKAERQSVNYKVQGSSAEMTKLAEGRAWKMRLEQKYDAQIIGAIHDELVASCAIEDLHGFVSDLHACMVAPYADMQVPIRSSISFGPNLGIQFECGEEPTAEAIADGLRQLAEWEEKQVEVAAVHA